MKAFIFLSVCPYMVTGNNPEALIDDVGGFCVFFLAEQHRVCTRHISAVVFWQNVIDEAGMFISVDEKKDTKGSVCIPTTTPPPFSLCYSPSVWLGFSHVFTSSNPILWLATALMFLQKKKKVNRDRLSGKDEFFLKEIFGTNFVSLCELNGEESLGLLKEIYMNMNGGKKNESWACRRTGPTWSHTKLWNSHQWFRSGAYTNELIWNTVPVRTGSRLDS